MRKFALLCVLALAACGPAYGPLKDYERSRAAYRACLMAKGAAGCANEKALMDADARAYAATSGQVLRTGPAD